MILYRFTKEAMMKESYTITKSFWDIIIVITASNYSKRAFV